MVSAVELLLAATPLLLAGALLVVFLWPATRAMPVAWIVALIIGFAVWNMPPSYLAASSLVGVMTAIQILWIVFGALLLLYTLKEAGAFDRINEGFAAVSDDRRVQIVLVAFFLATFIEGAAGFGTPAAVVAPLLLALGFPALAAVIAALIGHIIAVTYGAVGTPIIVGIQDPLASVEATRTAIEAGGFTVPEYSIQVATWAATYHALVGFVMPLFAVGMVVYFFGGDDRSLNPAFEVAPLCLFAGIAFVIPYWLAAQVSAEFPGLVGAMVGGAITVTVVRAGYLEPDSKWEFPPREEWPAHWVGTIEPGGKGSAAPDGSNDAAGSDAPTMSLLRAWSPYLVLVGLLVATRVVAPVTTFLQDGPLMTIEWNVLGTGIVGEIAWAYVPGTWLLVSALVAIPLFRLDGDEVVGAWREAARTVAVPAVVLAFVIAMVEVMVETDAHNGPIDGSMIVVLADGTAAVFGPAYPFVAPVVGLVGSFVTGSITVSNVTFAAFQFEIGTTLGLSTTVLLAGQSIGAAVGNLVAIHNVVAALATVGLTGATGRVVRLNLLPVVYYLVAGGLLTAVGAYVLFPTLF